MANTSLAARDLFKKWVQQNPEMSKEQAYLESQQALAEYVPQEGDPALPLPGAQFVGPELPQDVAFERGIDPRGAMSPTESFLAGGSQWGSGGAADEMAGALSVLKGGSYAGGRDAARSAIDAGYEQNPGAYAAGATIGGGALGVAGPGATSVRGGAAIGAILGGAQGLAESDADLTKGEYGQAALDTGLAAVVGAPLGVLGAKAPTIAKGAKRGVKATLDYVRSIGKPELRKTLTNQRVAGYAADAVDPNAVSGIGRKQDVAYKSGRANELEADVLEKTGKELDLRPSQKTGVPDLARKEAGAARHDDLFDVANAKAAEQADTAAQYLDALGDDIAANPAKLGRTDVGEEVQESILGVTKSLVAERSAATKPIVEEAMRTAQMGNASFGDVPNIPIPRALKIFNEAIKKGEQRLASPEARALASKLESYTKDGEVTLRELQDALSDWGEKAAPSGQIFKDVGALKDQRLSKNVRNALLEDLDAVVDGGGAKGEAGSLLRQFRDKYRAYSDQIDELDVKVIGKILGAGEDGTVDTITTKLLQPSTSPDEISFVFNVLDKSNADTAKQLRAQLFEDLLVKVGKPQRGMGETSRLGMNQLDYDKAAKAWYEHAPKFEAAFAGDKQALLNLSKTRELFEHLRYAPDLGRQGPSSAMAVGEAAGRMYGWKALALPQGVLGSSIRAIKSVVTDHKATARALTSSDGIEAFNQALELLIKHNEAVQQGRKVDWTKLISTKAAKALATTLTHLGASATSGQVDYNETKAGAEELVAEDEPAN